jgi:ATP-dependent DNA helicase RecQ
MLKYDEKKPLSNKGVAVSVDERLFEKLKDVRKHISEVSSIPSYIIFSDNTLKDMCAKQPTTRDEFIKVKGVGEIKMEKYGEAFMKAIRDYKNNK